MSSGTVLALAQRSSDDAAGALACAGCGGALIFALLIPLAIQVVLLVWVAKDAKARHVDAPVLWMIFVFFVPIVGILVYVFTRPEGRLVACPHCHNKRLEASATCPHCGN